MDADTDDETDDDMTAYYDIMYSQLGLTPLHIAANTGSLQILLLILDSIIQSEVSADEPKQKH